MCVTEKAEADGGRKGEWEGRDSTWDAGDGTIMEALHVRELSPRRLVRLCVRMTPPRSLAKLLPVLFRSPAYTRSEEEDSERASERAESGRAGERERERERERKRERERERERERDRVNQPLFVGRYPVVPQPHSQTATPSPSTIAACHCVRHIE